MKRTRIISLSLLLLGTLALLTGCNDSSDPLAQNAVAADLAADAVDADMTGTIGTIDTIEPGDLTDEDAASLVFMREEEKLARDVYLTLGGLYDLRVFQNIAVSEQRHMDAVAVLLERYGLEDPVGDNGVGKFVNEDLQKLYDELIASGTESVTGALLDGLAIEEIDIQDLREEIAATELEDITLVYNSLLEGSYNHLRAFARSYQMTAGEVYAPRYLTQEDYDAILAAAPGRGRGHRGGRW